MQNLKISSHTSSLVGLKMSAQKKFGNSSKADLKFFVSLAVLQTQNSKGRQIFQEKKFKKSLRPDFAYRHPLGMCKISGR